MENNKQPKKILIFSMSYYPRFVGGAEVALKEITDRLNDTEFEFHLITLRYDSLLPKYEKMGNVHVYRIGFTKKNPSFEDLRFFPLRLNKIIYQFWAPFFGLWLHRKVHFQKVWAMMAHSAGIPGNIFSRISGIQLLLTLQEGDPVDQIQKQMRLFGPFFSGVFRQAGQIQVISKFLKNWALQMNAKISPEVVPNGVDTREFAFLAKTNNVNEFRLITTSRLVPKNGVDLVIEAMTLLPHNVYFDIVGDGFQRGELEGRVTELGLQERIIFHGQKDKKEMIELLHKADIFIRPSRSEGLGNSFLEAMATGLPIIGTEVGGIPDFLFDPKTHKEKATGLFCTTLDFKSIANCVQDLIKDRSLYNRLQTNGVSLIEAEYTWDSVALRMKKILQA